MMLPILFAGGTLACECVPFDSVGFSRNCLSAALGSPHNVHGAFAKYTSCALTGPSWTGLICRASKDFFLPGLALEAQYNAGVERISAGLFRALMDFSEGFGLNPAPASTTPEKFEHGRYPPVIGLRLQSLTMRP